jgi:hypothetical protein
MAGKQRKKVRQMQQKFERRHKTARPVGIRGDYWVHRCTSGTWSSIGMHREECGVCSMTLEKVRKWEGRRAAIT